MTQVQLDSLAFRKALLQSERRRIYGIIVFLLVFTLASALRILIFGSHMNPLGIPALLVVVAYELWILSAVNRSLNTGGEVSEVLLFFSIIFEIAVIAFGIACFSSPRLAFEYRPIATPWVLALFPVLMLSVLRLNPRLSRISGVVAALGYLSSAYYLGWRPSFTELRQHTIEQTAVTFYAILILASGFIAAIISEEIRKHVQAALHEAETESQLKQVQHDLDIARSIQQSLLPRIRPSIPGLEISGWNLPADATGGDYFDWKRLRDGRLVVTLADVTGHGLGPALLASVCRAYSRSGFDTHADVLQALQHINRFFGEDLPSATFATFVAAVCSGESGNVEMLSAGHGPLFVYSSTRDAFDQFEAQTIPLGILPELSSSAPLQLHLEPNDMIVLATDGFFEWENDKGEDFGVVRLTDTIRATRHLPPEQIIAEIYSAVKKFSNGTRQLDDLTAVVIKRVEVAENRAALTP
jgi:serine phosphatase RsbU (regulator of sigma subunit)